MPFPLLLAIGAGLGLGKSFGIDMPREKRQRRLAAETQRLSPWTGLSASPVQEADPMGSALGFGLTGYQLDQGSKVNDLNNQLLQKAIDSKRDPMVGVGTAPMSWNAAAMPNPAMTGGGPVGVPAYNPNPYGTLSGGGWPTF